MRTVPIKSTIGPRLTVNATRIMSLLMTSRREGLATVSVDDFRKCWKAIKLTG